MRFTTPDNAWLLLLLPLLDLVAALLSGVGEPRFLLSRSPVCRPVAVALLLPAGAARSRLAFAVPPARAVVLLLATTGAFVVATAAGVTVAAGATNAVGKAVGTAVPTKEVISAGAATPIAAQYLTILANSTAGMSTTELSAALLRLMALPVVQSVS